uniref:Cytochrome c oxidase subunit 3 n=1 Tax=Monoblepharella sp. JEL15 TaxID=224130 RepID=Q85MB7_9FUNG|nr:cytochrome c oxidase subunit 3 [Monoblepharella sp. JEL15]AAO64965.1 cytochrome c oxidase subunit 3 [Monoblepharella sp. JEL15]
MNSVNLRHPYHLVDPSPWPILGGFAAFVFASGLIFSFKHGPAILVLGLISVLLVTFGWFRDITREGLGGKHTTKVQSGLMLGVLLFLGSEVLLFISFFWAYFHSSLSPDIVLGGVWPPIGIVSVDPWSIPLLGSIILLSSGATCTVAHNALINGNKDLAVATMFATVVLGFLFVGLQATEYYVSEFSIADSIFGTVFYMTTGLHGTHVIIGAIFLTVMLVRMVRDQFTTHHHLGLEFSLWYWHMVDVIWLFVFLTYYWWGSTYSNANDARHHLHYYPLIIGVLIINYRKYMY